MALVTLKNAIVSAVNSDSSAENSAKRPLNGNNPDIENYGSSDEERLIGTEQEGARLRNLSRSPSAVHDEDEAQGSTGILSIFSNSVDPRVMSDVIIGLSDGLTVPFALTAGLSSLGDSKLVITGGMAELVSGAISMGLGGFLAARSEADYYKNQVRKEKQEFFEKPELLADEIYDIMEDIGAQPETIELLIRDLEKSPKQMIDFIIRYGRGLEEPAENRQVTSALTIGLSYFFGGFVPLIPYFFSSTVIQGLISSIILMAFTLFWFGYIKTVVAIGEDCSTWKKTSEGLQMFLIGSIAASAAFGLVYLIE